MKNYEKQRFLLYSLLYILLSLFIVFVFINLFDLTSRNSTMRWLQIGDFQLINKDIIKRHYVAIIGLPLAAIFSLWVVIMLKNKSGPIEFKVTGFEFKGTSGQVILWILCFITITFAIKLVW